MNVLRAFKTELDLNNHQKTACQRHAGAARYAYNWGLERKMACRQAGEKIPTSVDLHRELNTLKKTELAWMYEVSKCAPQEALRDLDKAFANFFRRVKEKKHGRKIKVGHPRFKSKKNGPGSFRLNGVIRVFEKAIQLPRLGRLRLKERGYLPIAGVHILSATVSEKGGRWFVSLQVEQEIPEPQTANRPSVGLDLGINRMAQLSDGNYFENPRALKSALTKLKRLHRIVSRRKKGSANRKKAVHQLARTHTRVANIRKDALHKATTWLTKTKSAIVLEDLNVAGMIKNHHLSQAICDVGLYEFRRQLIYKGVWYGSQVWIADRFYPSTKRCSQCGQIKDRIGLDERMYQCEYCGIVIDRDLNAAINLEQLINQTTASSAESYACGERIRPGFPAMLDEAGTKHHPSRGEHSA
jgi:putative transposase